VLAALSLLGLGIFGPGIATGLTAGAPQLGAGAAVGTALAAGGLGVAGAVAARTGAGALVGAARSMSHVATGKAFASAVGETPAGGAGGPPAWARKLRRQQAMSHGVSATIHAIRSGDHGGGSTSVDLREHR
jgi:type IV secretion system protein TrbL